MLNLAQKISTPQIGNFLSQGFHLRGQVNFKSSFPVLKFTNGLHQAEIPCVNTTLFLQYLNFSLEKKFVVDDCIQAKLKVHLVVDL